MSQEKSPGRLLIIESEARLVETLQQHFEAERYQVYTAQTCREGLTLASSVRPNLILLATRMSDMAGLEAFRILRDTARTSHIPVMMMAGHHESVLQNKILEEGVYDFLEKPLDLDILTLRVRNALRRAEREGLTEPRTGLPTGRLITERLNALAEERGWYRITIRIEHFNVFRDLYGFVTANEALRFAGNLIAQLANEHGSPDDFVGHTTRAEEFVVVTTQDVGPALAETLKSRLTQELQSFYNFMERDQGYVILEDGAGGSVQKPLMAVQISSEAGEADPSKVRRTQPAEDVWVDAGEADANPKPDDTPPGSAFSW